MPENIMERLTKDDSPDIFNNWFWEFLGVDVQNADIKPWDFKNVLDMVDIAFINILNDFKEDEWENVSIVAYNENRQPVYAYHVTKLWDMIRAKMYLKMCRAREGFMLKQLTEKKSKTEQELRGYPGVPAPVTQGGQPQEKQKEGWKF